MPVVDGNIISRLNASQFPRASKLGQEKRGEADSKKAGKITWNVDVIQVKHSNIGRKGTTIDISTTASHRLFTSGTVVAHGFTSMQPWSSMGN